MNNKRRRELARKLQNSKTGSTQKQVDAIIEILEEELNLDIEV